MNATSRYLLPLLLLGSFSLSACAEPAPAPGGQSAGAPPGTAAARAANALRKLDPDIRPEHIQPAPVPGFQLAIVGGEVLYVSNDGKYLMQGVLYDIDKRRDAGSAALAGMRKALVDKVPLEDRIVFAPPDPKYTVTVFTDVECGFCRRMHGQIEQYMAQGIAVQYLAFPRMGPASADFRKMVSVWCAKDRREALTLAKLDKPVPEANCTNPVAMQYRIGQQAGLSGTPMVLAEDGTQLGGYVPPAELRRMLDKLAAGS